MQLKSKFARGVSKRVTTRTTSVTVVPKWRQMWQNPERVWTTGKTDPCWVKEQSV